MKRPRRFSHSSALLACALAVNAAAAFDGPAPSPELEQELVAILRSDAPGAEKAIACKKLSIHGSDAAVPDLARLLPDEQLSSWARIALEAIPGDAADDALRTAAKSLEGRLLIGTINSIGVRRDAKAVELLNAKLHDDNVDVASAAAVALGHIANEAAVKSLREALATVPENVRSAVAEGCVLCAERLHAEDQTVAAIEIYDEVRSADVPMQRIVEATRGAILARQQNGIALLLETFQSPDEKLFQLALGTAREFPGSEVDQALAAEMIRATPERAALIIQAMADRPATVELAAVLSAAETGPRQVRVSAIDALGRIGNDSCLLPLLEVAEETDADLVRAAKDTLANLPGDDVDAHIVQLLDNAEGGRYPLLLGLIGQRRVDAVPEVLKAIDHSDQDVRRAALVALGETVTLERLPVLVSQVVSPKHAEDAQHAQQALNAASIRMPDRESCAAELAMALDRSPPATKTVLLEILCNVGGTKALQTLASAAKSDDPQLQDTSSRLLGTWNSVDAAPVLLDLAKTAPAAKYQVRALRGYIGLARKFAMPDQQRAEMCRQALGVSRRPDEQKLVLEVLKLHPSIEALQTALSATRIPGLNDDATAAALVIANEVGSKGVDVSTMLSEVGLKKVTLEIVKAEYGAGATQTDVTAALRKHAKDLPLINLGTTGYNASFGGDPTPGVAKQLKIQYRIDGKPGEASFAENALIILPAPE
jgi:HEAT repeat protein